MQGECPPQAAARPGDDRRRPGEVMNLHGPPSVTRHRLPRDTASGPLRLVSRGCTSAGKPTSQAQPQLVGRLHGVVASRQRGPDQSSAIDTVLSVNGITKSGGSIKVGTISATNFRNGPLAL